MMSRKVRIAAAVVLAVMAGSPASAEPVTVRHAEGLVLGFLALRTRSFAGGALFHGLVACTMDVLAVREAGLF